MAGPIIWADYCELSTSENSDNSNFSPDLMVYILKKNGYYLSEGDILAFFILSFRPYPDPTQTLDVLKIPNDESFFAQDNKQLYVTRLFNSFHSSGHTLRFKSRHSN